ncbi:MAG: hypothetical protein DRO99_00060 [Candidatus Aenigmatarchaeota archaeon]|nr:MAG: hypothetical protein DRO99_00060 [Candidatus Aenigmarchaeota archaeon]
MKLVVIGSGPAGVVASLTVKTLQPRANVTVIGRDPVFVRCSAPYILAGKVDMEKCIEPDRILTERGIRVVRDEATEITKGHVKTASGKSFSFDHMIIATGARPIVPPIRGADKSNVFVIRGPKDVNSLNCQLSKPKNVVIIGGGMIGTEIAALLSERHKISIVEMLPRVLSASYDSEVTDNVENELKKMGVKLFLGTKVKSINGKTRAETVSVGNRDLNADIVIISAGIIPETDIAKKAGIKICKFGIKTNRYMETSMKNIYAVGDCAQTFSAIKNKKTGSGLANTAVLQAKIAGMNIAGKTSVFRGTVNASTTQISDLSLGSVGLTEQQARSENMKCKCGKSHTMTKYDMQPGARPLFTKLVFDSKERIIGGQVMGSGGIVPGIVDLLSFAIKRGCLADDLMMTSYSAHPELTSLPFANPVVMACEDMKCSD